MGYTTEFYGKFKFNKPVPVEVRNYINEFSETRHCIRDNNKIKNFIPNWKEKTYPLDKENLGKNGEFFVFNHRNISKDDFDFDFDDKNLIMDYNDNGEMPSLWCQWVVTDNCQFLEWDGCEKFYSYTNWLCYLIDNFFAPYGYILNGTVDYQGEDEDDYGQITICDNTVYVY